MQTQLRRLTLFGLVLLTSFVSLQAQPKKKLALVGGMLVDGYETPPIHHAIVLIEGNKIVHVGRAAETTIPSDATVIDTSGRVMMPGLIELHGHLMILGHGLYDRWFPWVEKNGGMDRVMEISAKQMLMAGVTSATDLGGPLQESLSVRDRINGGKTPGPRMWMSGPWVSRRPGRPPYYYGKMISSPEEAARTTEELIKAGVDVIKTHAGLTVDDTKAIVETAHKHNRKVHAHAYNLAQVVTAVKGGVDVIQHAGSADSQPYDPSLVREIVESGIAVVITAVHRVGVYWATVDFPERLQAPQLKKDFPPDVYKEVQDSFKHWHTLPYFANSDRGRLFFTAAMKQWIDSGAILGMGTDSGTPMNFHTESLWREIKLHVDAGMSPQRAISAATRIGARVLGKGSELGTIEAGKLADIIVVRGNPLFDIAALADPEIVIKDGIVFKGTPPHTGTVTDSRR